MPKPHQLPKRDRKYVTTVAASLRKKSARNTSREQTKRGRKLAPVPGSTSSASGMDLSAKKRRAEQKGNLQQDWNRCVDISGVHMPGLSFRAAMDENERLAKENEDEQERRDVYRRKTC